MALVKGNATRLQAGAGRTQDSCEQLQVELESTDAETRRHGARELAHCPGSSMALLGRLEQEQDGSVRAAILTALIRLDEPPAIAGLANLLRTQDPALRNEAIEALRELAGGADRAGAVPPVLAVLLADPDPDLRVFAVNILEAARYPDVERWLIDVIDKDPHVNVCATALDLLCEVGTEAALEPVARLKTRFSGEAYIQFAAGLAIQRIRPI